MHIIVVTPLHFMGGGGERAEALDKYGKYKMKTND